MIIGSRLTNKMLDELNLSGEDLNLLKKVTKTGYGQKEHAKKHADLMAWDLANCLAQWSNEFYGPFLAPKVEVLVDYDSLEELQNPVNLNLHYHEELVGRTTEEINDYKKLLNQEYRASNREEKTPEGWYNDCISKQREGIKDQDTSVRGLDINSLCKTISAARTVRFMSGSSLRILRQFIEHKVAFKVDCYVQAGTQDFAANLFTNQFNIGLNIEAASFVLREYKQFSSFTVVPSATAQCLRYSLAGLQRVGHECLGKKLLGYNAKVDAEHIASGKYSLEEQFPDEIALMPDLTTFLCVLKKKELGAFITYVEVAYSMEDDLWNGKFEEGKLETSEPQRTKNGRIQEGVILRLKDAEHGIPIYRLPRFFDGFVCEIPVFAAAILTIEIDVLAYQFAVIGTFDTYTENLRRSTTLKGHIGCQSNQLSD
ncbi:unnamed protein product, partial [Clonostachys rosea f. rosea IK726]